MARTFAYSKCNGSNNLSSFPPAGEISPQIFRADPIIKNIIHVGSAQMFCFADIVSLKMSKVFRVNRHGELRFCICKLFFAADDMPIRLFFKVDVKYWIEEIEGRVALNDSCF